MCVCEGEREREIKLNIQRHSCISCIQQGGAVETLKLHSTLLQIRFLSHTLFDSIREFIRMCETEEKKIEKMLNKL